MENACGKLLYRHILPVCVCRGEVWGWGGGGVRILLYSHFPVGNSTFGKTIVILRGWGILRGKATV